ncbi:MAG: DNA polymerase III subunit beta [Planctomycetes bacterium]|nr:DNA polymerase III subunit beta [Planctomycetota bacterium]MCB9905128.1 DNA polymerase III subunit beta [Planctomycetota bacterium]
MKVTCDREKLREGLAVVNNVIPARSTKPVLENVKLVAKDDCLELVGTDLEVAIRYKLMSHQQVASDDESSQGDTHGLVEIAEPGVAVVPARVALDFVKDLVGNTVTLETRENTLHIFSGPDTCELVTADSDEYPTVNQFDPEDSFGIQGGVFTRLVAQTAFAAAREAGRYAMHGVLMDLSDETLKLVATDGRRLALTSHPIPTTGYSHAPVIVPAKGMQLFCRVIDDPLAQIAFHFYENEIGMRAGNAEVFARLIDGEFPKYAAVIPSSTAEHMEADADLLTRKLRLVANVTGAEARAVRLSMKTGELVLAGHSAGRGEAHAEMEVEYKGDAAEIAFNPDYVLEGLRHCEKQTVALEFNDRLSPGKFTLGESYTYIVMPITVDTH